MLFLTAVQMTNFRAVAEKLRKKTKENTEMENIQISFDEKLFSEIDRAVSATRLSRSEIVNKAVMHRLRKKRDALFRDRMD
jgi:peptide subunit release factor 1 (eRF1)